ncbi:MAG TPA: sulfatase-like hydrolase/transferase, partial [Tepidisphaeraceae bacterium]
DDQRFDALGAAGNPKIHTPNLDRLCSEGVYFHQSTVVVPQCSPVRASLLTGVVPHQNGWLSNQYQRPEATGTKGLKGPFLPQLLQDAGYLTVLVGKWHLDVEPWESGFTDVRTWLPGGGGLYRGEPLAKGNSRKPHDNADYTNIAFSKDAEEFLKSDAAKEKPFFMWLALTCPHTPWNPNPPEIANLYEGKKSDDLLPPGFPEKIPHHNFLSYYKATSLADLISGRIEKAITEAGLADNTMFVFLGDNGFMMGQKGIGAKGAAGKVVPYEASARTPLMIKGAGVKLKGKNEACVSSIDLPPTFLALAGAKVPDTFVGRDMSALLAGESGADKNFNEAFVEFADNQSDRFGTKAYRSIRTATHKLIVWDNADSKPELYDVAKDPLEDHNLYGTAEAKSIQDDLSSRLVAWLKRTKDDQFKWPR